MYVRTCNCIIEAVLSVMCMKVRQLIIVSFALFDESLITRKNVILTEFFMPLTEGIAINLHFLSRLGLSDNEEGIERERSAISRRISNEAHLSIYTLKLLWVINVSLMCL